MKKRSLKIVKINAQKSPQYRQEFVNQSINYLKIIENKDKVKYEYLNKDFDPKHDLKHLSGRKLEYPNPNVYDPDVDISTPITNYAKTPALKSELGKYTFDIPLDSDDEDYHPKKRSFTPPRPPIVEGIKNVDSSLPVANYSPPRPQIITHTDKYSPHNTSVKTPQLTDKYSPHNISVKTSHTPNQTPQLDTPKHSTSHRFNHDEKKHSASCDNDNAANHESVYNYDLHTPTKEGGQYSKLRDFLNGSDNEESDDDYYGKRRNHKLIDPYKYMSEDQKHFNRYSTGPPTLDELEKRGEYSGKQEYMDVYKMQQMIKDDNTFDNKYYRQERDNHSYHSNSKCSSRKHSISSKKSINSDVSYPLPQVKEDILESIDDKKRDLLGKLDMLRKKYPEQSQNIPFMTMNSSLTELEYLYYSELRKLEIDNDVNDYRTYLIGFFMITEFILGKFLRLDLEGFTQQQMLNMRRYERFLIEIGEKNYVPDGHKWPVEVRLIGFVLIQAAIFTASKIILNKTGTNLIGMFNSFNAQSQNMGGRGGGGGKRKMKMPDVDLDDDYD